MNEIQQEERSLDTEIKKWLKRKDLIIKALTYQKNNEVQKINRLIHKWRGVSQQASNYLLNSMQAKIMHMGGYSNWKTQQKEKALNQSFGKDSHMEDLSEFINSEEFSNLSSYEQSDIMEQFNDISSRSIMKDESRDSDCSSQNDQLGMREFYCMLKMDYALVYDADDK